MGGFGREEAAFLPWWCLGWEGVTLGWGRGMEVDVRLVGETAATRS